MSTVGRSARAIRLRRRAQAPVARDAAVGAIAFALMLGMLSHASGGSRGLDALGVLLSAIACLPLLAHRRAPLAVFAVCTAASATTEGLGFALGPPIGATVALFYVAADPRTPGRMRQTTMIVIALAAVHVAVAAGARSGLPTVAVLGAIIIWGGAWIIGDQLRQRRQRLADLIERAQRAERETERQRRLAAAEERTRIARDLHDSAAHAINVILVQAAGARLLQDREPDTVRGALETIENVARETIAEIDQLIGALRTDVEGDVAQSRPGIELPAGLASAESLAARYRTAGLAVAVDADGRPRSLAPGVDQAAYRILQESLTNAARHGGGGADVQITYADEQLELTIANPIGLRCDGERTTSGYGVLGMRERAALLGGTVDTDASRGVFRVHARLPYQPVHTTVR